MLCRPVNIGAIMGGQSYHTQVGSNAMVPLIVLTEASARVPHSYQCCFDIQSLDLTYSASSIRSGP